MKIFYKHILVTLGIYLFCYAFYSFCIWELRNPIEWIIKIPTYGQSQRGVLLFFWVFYHIVVSVILIKTEEEKLK